LIVTIHQPNYFPYPGFFQKVLLSDIYVILDRAQFEFDITNRNKIITPEGSWSRISVPIKKGQKFFDVRNVEINNDQPWAEKNWDLICKSYNDSPFFDLYKTTLNSIFKKKWNLIFDLNFYTLKKAFEWLDIKTEFILDSELDVTGRSSEHLLNICKKLGATKYLSGPSGKNYLNEKIFEQSKIKVEYQKYDPIIYPQKYAKSFIPNLSILDLLFNTGSDSKKLLTKR
tara:strand:+ start:860 stop:1543 length:684 start_codon:yes stop_codon:yes gene_type:complete